MKYQNPYGVTEPVEDASYVNGDPSIARQGSIIPAAAVEFPQREIVNFIEASALVPSDNDLLQLTRATRRQWVNWCEDTGSANNLSVALDPPLTQYRQGLPLRVLVKTNNTGPTTINVNGLGNRPIVRANGAALALNDLAAGMIALLVDDGTRFQLVNFQGVSSSSINNFDVDIPYAEDSSSPGTPNNVTGIYTPAITSTVSGDLVLIKIAEINAGAVLFKVNALADAPITRNDGQPLQEFDLIAGEILLLVYNVNHWQVMRLVRSQVFFKLSANLILYVRTDGDDGLGHDGSTNTAAKAFKTVQRAVDYVKSSFLIGGRTVTIQLGNPGTYIGQVVVTNVPGRLVIKGDPSNPNGSPPSMNSYVLQGPYGSTGHQQVFVCSGSGIDVTLQGLTFSVQSFNSHVIQCDYGATLYTDNIVLAGVQTNGSGICTTDGSVICANYIHQYSHLGSLFFAVIGGTITLGAWYHAIYMHGIGYTGAFAQCNTAGIINIWYGYANFLGSAFGPRSHLLLQFHRCHLQRNCGFPAGQLAWFDRWK